jgi:hypothetical protein
MKIVQDSESGEVDIQLKENEEEYDIEEHLQSLTEFVFKQAIKLHELSNYCKQLEKRLEALERGLGTVSKQ